MCGSTGLAGDDVDRGDERREIAVADDDLVPAFGQGQLGERRGRARRRAVDLDLAPRADRDPDRAGGERSPARRPRGADRARGLRAPWLRAPALLGGLLGRRGGRRGRRRDGRRRRRACRGLGLRAVEVGPTSARRRCPWPAPAARALASAGIGTMLASSSASWAAGLFAPVGMRSAGAAAPAHGGRGRGDRRRRAGSAVLRRRRSALPPRRCGGRTSAVGFDAGVVATAVVAGDAGAALPPDRRRAGRHDRQRRGGDPGRAATRRRDGGAGHRRTQRPRRPGRAGLASSHWRSSRANERAERKRCSGSLAIARAAISASAFGTDGSTLLASGGSWLSTASRDLRFSESPRNGLMSVSSS